MLKHLPLTCKEPISSCQMLYSNILWGFKNSLFTSPYVVNGVKQRSLAWLSPKVNSMAKLKLALGTTLESGAYLLFPGSLFISKKALSVCLLIASMTVNTGFSYITAKSLLSIPTSPLSSTSKQLLLRRRSSEALIFFASALLAVSSLINLMNKDQSNVYAIKQPERPFLWLKTIAFLVAHYNIQNPLNGESDSLSTLKDEQQNELGQLNFLYYSHENNKQTLNKDYIMAGKLLNGLLLSAEIMARAIKCNSDQYDPSGVQTCLSNGASSMALRIFVALLNRHLGISLQMEARNKIATKIKLDQQVNSMVREMSNYRRFLDSRETDNNIGDGLPRKVIPLKDLFPTWKQNKKRIFETKINGMTAKLALSIILMCDEDKDKSNVSNYEEQGILEVVLKQITISIQEYTKNSFPCVTLQTQANLPPRRFKEFEEVFNKNLYKVVSTIFQKSPNDEKATEESVANILEKVGPKKIPQALLKDVGGSYGATHGLNAFLDVLKEENILTNKTCLILQHGVFFTRHLSDLKLKLRHIFPLLANKDLTQVVKMPIDPMKAILKTCVEHGNVFPPDLRAYPPYQTYEQSDLDEAIVFLETPSNLAGISCDDNIRDAEKNEYNIIEKNIEAIKKAKVIVIDTTYGGNTHNSNINDTYTTLKKLNSSAIIFFTASLKKEFPSIEQGGGLWACSDFNLSEKVKEQIKDQGFGYSKNQIEYLKRLLDNTSTWEKTSDNEKFLLDTDFSNLLLNKIGQLNLSSTDYYNQEKQVDLARNVIDSQEEFNVTAGTTPYSPKGGAFATIVMKNTNNDQWLLRFTLAPRDEDGNIREYNHIEQNAISNVLKLFELQPLQKGSDPSA